MTRPIGSLNIEDRVDFVRFVGLEVQGLTTKEIIKELWGQEEGTKEYASSQHRLSRWRRNPQYKEVWLEEIGQMGARLLTKGLRKLRDQLNAGEPWLENKAANDIVNFGKSRIFGDDERAVTVKIEGLPDLGTPDSLEAGKITALPEGIMVGLPEGTDEEAEDDIEAFDFLGE